MVTLAAVVPLAVLASRADDAKPVPDIAQGLWVTGADTAADTDSGQVPLSGATIAQGTNAVVTIEIEGTSAAAWALFEAEGEQLSTSSISGSSPLALDLALSALETGVYDLLVSATIDDAEVVERAARFEIGDAP